MFNDIFGLGDVTMNCGNDIHAKVEEARGVHEHRYARIIQPMSISAVIRTLDCGHEKILRTDKAGIVTPARIERATLSLEDRGL